MHAVIFEVWPKRECREEYLGIAADLKQVLETVDGFISVERFESLSEPGKVLSLSFWRDEDAIARWRHLTVHRSAQSRGRNDLFENYRLRVVSVVRDYGMTERAEAPLDSLSVHDGKKGPA